jgi:hypothetical protein
MTVGGSKEMLEKAFTASPRGVSSSRAVTTVRPVMKRRLTYFIRSRSGRAGAVMEFLLGWWSW